MHDLLPDTPSESFIFASLPHCTAGSSKYELASKVVRNTLSTCNTSIATGAVSSLSRGAGLYANTGTVEIVICAFAINNTQGIWRQGGSVNVRNSIVYWNGAAQIEGVVNVAYSNVQGCYDGEGNICANPCFFNADCGCPDFRITPVSPCIDAGDPDPKYNDSNACSNPPLGSERNDVLGLRSSRPDRRWRNRRFRSADSPQYLGRVPCRSDVPSRHQLRWQCRCVRPADSSGQLGVSMMNAKRSH